MTDNKFLQTIGANLRAVRAASGLTQAKLAEKAKVSLQSISNVERAVYPTTADVLSKLAVALNVPVSRFFDADLLEGVKSSHRVELSALVDLLRDQKPEVVKEIRDMAASVLGLKKILGHKRKTRRGRSRKTK